VSGGWGEVGCMEELLEWLGWGMDGVRVGGSDGVGGDGSLEI
jgi:hypothetical protein